MSDYRPLMELKQGEDDVFLLLQHRYLEQNYVLSLWKDVDEVIGWGERNIYMIRNSQDLQPGKAYRIFWINDDRCT